MDEIDRELTSAFSIEPSPEFRARVRARIAGEPLPRPWYLQWRVAAAMAAAVIAVTGVAIVRVIPTQPAGAAGPVAENRPAAPARAPLKGEAAAPAQPPHVAVMAPRRRAPRAGAPEVVADDTAMRGLRQLDAIVREGRTGFVFADEHVVLPEPVRDIVITPIAVAPIEIATNAEPVGSSEGDQQ
jgi:hypothetical protein